MKRFTCGIILLFIVNFVLFYPQKTNAINGSESPKKIQIDENFEILYQFDQISDISVVQVFLNAGQRQEPSGFQGISYLSSWLSVGLPDRGKINRMMNLGSTFSLQVDGDVAVITVKCLTKNLDETLILLSYVMLNPLVSSLRISEVKKQMKFALETLEDDSILSMNFSLMNSFFESPGYGGSVYGTKETQGKIKRKNILDFHNRHFNLKNMIISIATDLEEEAVKKIFTKHFEGFTVGKLVNPPATKILIPDKKEIITKKETDEILLAYGFPLPAATTGKNFCLAMMLEVLVGRGVGSRLWEIREDKNIAYIAEADLFRMKEAGILALYVKTGPGEINKADKALKEIISSLWKSGITSEELKITKKYSMGEMMRQLETKYNRSLFMGIFEFYGLGFDFTEKIYGNIDAITLQEMNDFIKETFNPDRRVKVVIGPGGEPKI
jgi:predicted Zn-dependent peptidase